MPGMDGTDLAQILKSDPKTKNIPILFLTALGTRGKDAGYVSSGSDVVFAKPFDFEELASKISELLNPQP